MRRGLVAEFLTAEALIEAARSLRAEGFSELDAWTPFPVKGLEEAIGMKRSPIAWVVGIIGFGGAAAAYLIQWYVNAVDYPLLVGGRPAHAAPAFVPITFETGVLVTATAGVLAILILGKMPSLWRPVFEVPGFERATIDRFFLGVPATDDRFDRETTTEALRARGAVAVTFAGEEIE